MFSAHLCPHHMFTFLCAWQVCDTTTHAPKSIQVRLSLSPILPHFYTIAASEPRNQRHLSPLHVSGAVSRRRKKNDERRKPRRNGTPDACHCRSSLRSEDPEDNRRKETCPWSPPQKNTGSSPHRPKVLASFRRRTGTACKTGYQPRCRALYALSGARGGARKNRCPSEIRGAGGRGRGQKIVG